MVVSRAGSPNQCARSEVLLDVAGDWLHQRVEVVRYGVHDFGAYAAWPASTALLVFLQQLYAALARRLQPLIRVAASLTSARWSV